MRIRSRCFERMRHPGADVICEFSKKFLIIGVVVALDSIIEGAAFDGDRQAYAATKRFGGDGINLVRFHRAPITTRQIDEKGLNPIYMIKRNMRR
jgi:hypothetical protein